MSEHVLEREVWIRARRETVFAFFQHDEAFAEWWGAGSTIEPSPGGAVRIVYPNGAVASGSVVAVKAPEQIVFTFGYEGEGKPIPPGGSTVTVTLTEGPAGTRVHLEHRFDDADVRDLHVPGWRYQLAVFANVAARAQHADLDARLDRWFAAWAELDEGLRRTALAELCTTDVAFRDPYASLRGLDELVAHVTAALAHGVGGRMERVGSVRHCQGTALVDWRVPGPAESAALTGTNVVELAPDGRLAAVVGFRTG